jgi:hypothetical protein
MNDIDYIFKLINEYLPNLGYMLNLHINKENCDNLYFSELNKFLDIIIKDDYLFPENQYTNIKKCINMNINKNCFQDIFHPTKDSVQFLLGKFNIVNNCFSNCKNYFIINLKIWSIFRNDLLIRYICTHNKIENKLIDEIFPIRIVLSNNNENYIAPYKNKYMKSLTKLLKNYFIEYNSNISKERKIQTKKTKKYAKKYDNNELLNDKNKYSKKMTKSLKTQIVDYQYSNNSSREIFKIQKCFYILFLKKIR